MRWHSQPGKKEKKKGKARADARAKGKGNVVKDPAENGGSVVTKREAAKAAGRKGANQRCNGRFFGVLPETRSTGETTRTKTDAQSILRDRLSESGNERINKGKSRVTPDGKQQTNKGERRGASS